MFSVLTKYFKDYRTVSSFFTLLRLICLASVCMIIFMIPKYHAKWVLTV